MGSLTNFFVLFLVLQALADPLITKLPNTSTSSPNGDNCDLAAKWTPYQGLPCWLTQVKSRTAEIFELVKLDKLDITKKKQNEIMAALLALQSANPKVDDFHWPPPSYITETATGIPHLIRRAISVSASEMVPQVKATLQELADFIQWKQLKLPAQKLDSILSSSDKFGCLTAQQLTKLGMYLGDCKGSTLLTTYLGQGIVTNQQTNLQMLTWHCFFGRVINNNNPNVSSASTNINTGEKKASEIYSNRPDKDRMKNQIESSSLSGEMQKKTLEDLNKCLVRNVTTNDLIVAHVAENKHMALNWLPPWISSLMNGHTPKQVFPPSIASRAKHYLITMKAMLCMVESLIVNGCPLDNAADQLD